MWEDNVSAAADTYFEKQKKIMFHLFLLQIVSTSTVRIPKGYRTQNAYAKTMRHFNFNFILLIFFSFKKRDEAAMWENGVCS